VIVRQRYNTGKSKEIGKCHFKEITNRDTVGDKMVKEMVVRLWSIDVC
jgi:hypothetical protein